MRGWRGTASVATFAWLLQCSSRGALPTSPVADASAAHADASVDATPETGAADAGGPDRRVEDAEAGDAIVPCADGGRQTDLACTGLYSDFAGKVVAPDVLPYAPAFPLWSDGAVKSRWIRLPAGTTIDTSNMDEWVFPVATRFWKEFVINGQRIETRVITKQPDGTWLRQTFRWSADESSASELVGGERNVAGTTYEIPSEAACELCHSGRVDGVLGFEAISLAGPGATGLTYPELVRQGRVTGGDAGSLALPGNATEQAALGWLHANCGTACHNQSPFSRANFTYLFLRLNVAQLGSVAETDTVRTTVNFGSTFQPYDGGALPRIMPGDPSRSVVFVRASTRDDAMQVQMPPFVTHRVDDAGVLALEDWIRAMPP
jgi:hypothetical protein